MPVIIEDPEFSTWLSELRDRVARVKIAARLLRMASGNLGDTKSVGEGVLEARVHHGPGYRLYMLVKGEVLIVMLCGGTKRAQRRDIGRAIELAKDYDQ